MEENEVVKKTENKQDEQREENNLNGVDLAKNEKTKEKEEQEQIQEKSKLDEIILQQTADITLGEIKNIMDTLDIVGMGEGQAKLMLGNAVIGIVQNGKIEYTRNARTAETEEILKKLNEEIEEQQKAEQEQKERDTGEREEEKKPETIKDDNEKKPEQEETAVHESEEIKRDSSWIEIRSDRETDECRTFMGMIKKEYPHLVKGTERLFIAPNPKDANDYNLYAMDGNGKITAEIPLEQTEGRNPMQEDVLQYERDGSNAKTKQPIQMLKIGNSPNNPIIMIYNGTRTDTQIHIGSRSQGDNYQSHQISSSRSQNDIQDAKESVKDATSSNLAERTEGDTENERYYQTLKQLEHQNVPDEINPAKDENEISDVEVENFDKFRVSFAETLMKEYDISKECAAYVAVEVLDNGKDFNETLDEATQILEEEKRKEQEGKIPPGSAERSAAAYYEDRLTPEQQAEIESEEYTRGDPRTH